MASPSNVGEAVRLAKRVWLWASTGYLSARSPDDTAHLVEAFRSGLNENGFVEGPRPVRSTADHGCGTRSTTRGDPCFDRRRTGSGSSKGGDRAIPIVFAMGGDLVKLGLVASYNRPGGNATGVDILTNTLEAKRIGLLHELVPQASVIGVLLDPGNTPAVRQLSDIQEAARALGLQNLVLQARTDRELDAAFEMLAQERVLALTVAGAPFFDTRREKLVALG